MPDVTAYFWIIKVLCTTVGETAADLLNEKAGLGLTGVSVLMSGLLAVVLVVQFRTTDYRAGVYWLAVALKASTAVFVVWYRREGMLPIHGIDTTGREAYYWLAVLFTLAIGAVAVAHFALGLDAVRGFWIAYVLTRPLGASIGDHLSRPAGDGGLGLGTVVTGTSSTAGVSRDGRPDRRMGKASPSHSRPAAGLRAATIAGVTGCPARTWRTASRGTGRS